MPARLLAVDWTPSRRPANEIPNPVTPDELSSAPWQHVGAFYWSLALPGANRHNDTAEVTWEGNEWHWRVTRDGRIIADGSLEPEPLSPWQNLELCKRYCQDGLRFLQTVD